MEKIVRIKIGAGHLRMRCRKFRIAIYKLQQAGPAEWACLRALKPLLQAGHVRVFVAARKLPALFGIQNEAKTLTFCTCKGTPLVSGLSGGEMVT